MSDLDLAIAALNWDGKANEIPNALRAYQVGCRLGFLSEPTHMFVGYGSPNPLYNWRYKNPEGPPVNADEPLRSVLAYLTSTERTAVAAAAVLNPFDGGQPYKIATLLDLAKALPEGQYTAGSMDKNSIPQTSHTITAQAHTIAEIKFTTDDKALFDRVFKHLVAYVDAIQILMLLPAAVLPPTGSTVGKLSPSDDEIKATLAEMKVVDDDVKHIDIYKRVIVAYLTPIPYQACIGQGHFFPENVINPQPRHVTWTTHSRTNEIIIGDGFRPTKEAITQMRFYHQLIMTYIKVRSGAVITEPKE